MVWLVLAPIVLGVSIYYLPQTVAKAASLAGQVAIAGLAVWTLLPAWTSGDAPSQVLGGTNPLLYISLRGDAISLSLVVLTSVLFLAATLSMLREEFMSSKLLLLLGCFQGLTNGIFLTDDIFNLFVLFEVSTIVGILLLLFRKKVRSFYDGLYYLTIQIVAMMFFLFGVAYLYRSFGVLTVSAVADMVASGAVSGIALVLTISFMLAGLGLKAGFFPLFSWVPRVYGNPGAPVAVLALMSGLFIKGSVFWVARLVHAFAPAVDLRGFLTVIAVVTALAAAGKALVVRDLRISLAFSTIAQVGLITVGILAVGDDGGRSMQGASLHLFHHALVKTILFLTAGLIVSRYGTGKIAEIRGVARRQPAVAAMTVIAAFGMIGLPFTAGGASKYLIESGLTGWPSVALYAVNIGTVLVMVRYCSMLFGKPVTSMHDGALGDNAQARAAVDTQPMRGYRLTAVTAGVLTIAVVVLGALAAPVTAALTGAPVSIDPVALLGKLPTLAIMVGAAIVVYRLLHVKARAAVGPREYSLSLPNASLALTVFFAVTVLVGMRWG
jgi:multicomponent Na+:H+ antiporter subunit D